ncbi:hypothetical protein QE152_g569 [Popillia japonica]|uniref:Uncharacterized protein n=1 Tax=Popillia japonica TaxID=7064 RepID=A0AAW1NJN1_POPJA
MIYKSKQVAISLNYRLSVHRGSTYNSGFVLFRTTFSRLYVYASSERCDDVYADIGGNQPEDIGVEQISCSVAGAEAHVNIPKNAAT